MCVGGGGGGCKDICFNRSPHECSRSQSINCLNTRDFYSRTPNSFDLIARYNHPTNFGLLMYHRLICELIQF